MLAFLLPFVLSNWKFVLGAGLIAGVVGFGLYEYHHIYSEGEQAATQAIKDANAAAMARAAAAQTTVDACYAAGFAWDVNSGTCVTK